MRKPKLKWQDSHVDVSFVPYSKGHLIRIEYNFKKQHWDISLFNYLELFNRDGQITERERIQCVAEGLLRNYLVELDREIGEE